MSPRHEHLWGGFVTSDPNRNASCERLACTKRRTRLEPRRDSASPDPEVHAAPYLMMLSCVQTHF